MVSALIHAPQIYNAFLLITIWMLVPFYGLGVFFVPLVSSRC